MLIQGKEKFMMSCDWLQFTGHMILDIYESADAPEILCPIGHRLEIQDGTNVFRYRGILYDSMGNKELSILWSPKSKVIAKTIIMFEVANFFLYENNYGDVLALTQQVHPYKFANPTRYDICVDFEMTAKRRRIIEGIYKNTMYLSSKREGSVFWSAGVADGMPYPHCLSFGSKKSDFKWKIYNKTKELQLGTNEPQKPYIWQRWQAFGMDIYNIWRCEVSVTAGNGVMVNNRRIDLEDLCNSAWLYKVFANLYENRLIIRKKEKHTRKKNDTRVWLFKLPLELSAKVSAKETTEKQVDDRATKHLNRLIDMIQSPICMQTPPLFDAYANALTEIVCRGHLANYFQTIKGMTYNEWLDMMWEEYSGQGWKDMRGV